MPIQILPPQLANQIAAGEVVERPASVVKELVENALDAGASQIEIEIDKGGHKRILIRDNGKGIDKEELSLALSRHATSKITDIEDLEAIVSLGFRGEALASISSVSRLTMTSKPAQQKEAWSAIAEGLDMAVKVLPAAHPNGTSVEVLDLFFNTPARRKFLRAEKTEFSHIENLIKRIALSRPDVTFVLKHNGKLVKRYRSQAKVEDVLEQKSNRIAEVINQHFVDAANVVASHYDQVKISVWVKQPSLCVSVNPAQFSFVNGRMMRDKLIQHAIRQAYGAELGPEQLPEYVVFIELPAQDVDVNVHPAKHEVRFHYARLLHDLLVKTMEEALAGFNQQQTIAEVETPDWIETSRQNYQQAQAATEIVKSELKQAEPKTDLLASHWSETANLSERPSTKPEQRARPTANTFPGLKPRTAPSTQTTWATDKVIIEPSDETTMPLVEANQEQVEVVTQSTTEQVEIVFVEQQRYYYICWQQQLWLVDSADIFGSEQISISKEQLTPAPLLVPTRLKLASGEKAWCLEHEAFLGEHGFETKLHQDYLIIKQVPVMLRSTGATQTLPNVFSRLMATEQATTDIFANIISESKTDSLSDSQKRQKLSQFISENKLNLEQVAIKVQAQDILTRR